MSVPAVAAPDRREGPWAAAAARAAPALRAWLWLLVVVAVGLAALAAASGRIGFYEDEGLNLLKALMVRRGHPLYQEVFSDQAPAFTWMLAGLMDWFGSGLAGYRLVSLLFGLAVLAGTSAVASALAGRGAGLLCAALLLLSLPFLKFATTVIITIPALALGVWSLFFCLRYQAAPDRQHRLLISGALLGLACTVKLAAIYFAPIVLVRLLLPPGDRAVPARGRVVGLWLIGLLVPLAIVASLLPLASAAPQLLQTHRLAFDAFREETAATRYALFLAPGAPLFGGAALLALVLLLRRRGREAALPAAWLLVTGAWVASVRPLWTHHLPDLVCALSVCVAAGGALGLQQLRQRAAPGRRRWRAVLHLSPVLLAAAAAILHVRSYGEWQRAFANAPESSLRAVAGLVARETSPDDWVIVDRSIVAFLADRRVPPALAMLSRKRMRTVLADSDLTGALDRYRPALLVLCTGELSRFEGFRARIEAGYVAARRVPLRDGARAASCMFLRRRS